MSNKLRRLAKYQINSVKHIATEFIMSNKLRHASPPERLPKLNLLCKQKSSMISDERNVGWELSLIRFVGHKENFIQQLNMARQNPHRVGNKPSRTDLPDCDNLLLLSIFKK